MSAEHSFPSQTIFPQLHDFGGVIASKADSCADPADADAIIGAKSYRAVLVVFIGNDGERP